MLHKWEEKSKEFIGNFVDMFGKEGRLVSRWKICRAKPVECKSLE
jgi:hypothetical protein